LTKSKTRDSSLAQLEPNEWRPLARLWHLHARLFLSAAFGVAVTLILLAVPWPMSARVLIGWDSGVALYLALAYRATAHASVANIRRRAAINDEGAIAVLVLTTAAALASLAAVLVELGHTPQAYRIVLGIGTILLSWTFMHEDPDYWDFLYYALVVAMTAQVSDVQITNKSIRRLTTVHGVISFFFNVTVLALTINIVSTLMQ